MESPFSWMEPTSCSGVRPPHMWVSLYSPTGMANTTTAAMAPKKIFFFLITAVMIAVFAYCYVRLLNQKSYRILRMLCVTYTAGALGNLIDRIFRGYVVDMIYFVPINFPVFNVADCYITVSTVILLIALFFCYQDDDFSFLKPSGKAGKKHE